MRAAALALIALLIAAAAWPRGGGAVLVGRLVLPEPGALSGLSGIEVAAAGRRFVALSDRSRVIEGRLRRRAGRIAGIGDLAAWPLPGAPDSEGLARGPDGALHISTEGPARVLTFAGRRPAGVQPPRHGPWSRLGRHAALEALAIDPAGRLVTLPEGPRFGLGPFPIWRLEGGRWTRIGALGRRGAYLPVGADFGPDGRLYVLERAFLGPFGFQSRVRRLDPAGGRPAETVLTTGAGRFGNMEGLALWRAGPGDLRLLTVADDDLGSQAAFAEFALR